MKILINALGIQDSGGLTVLYKMLTECLESKNKYYIVCNDNQNIEQLINRFKSIEQFDFIVVSAKGFLYRLYYENMIFKQIIKKYNIDLIYNFSGTSQLFLKIPQLTKIQNLLFYSKELDHIYLKHNKILLWLKQIYFKRVIFKTMANHSKYLEIQSPHIKEYMADFINIKNKTFFIKSDIDVDDVNFLKPKKYDFDKKIKFLYIVGPHFQYIHKNFQDFIDVMAKFEKLNIDFEINITLNKSQLENTLFLDEQLRNKTNFLGYLPKEKLKQYFSDNTVLISTSIIETLGLHVIEAVQNGIIPIVPDTKYSHAVYGETVLTYSLFDSKSLLNSILSIIENKIDCKNYILTLQNNLKENEKDKYQSIVDVFKEISKR